MDKHFDLCIRYERVGDDRIRFYVPKDTPIPDLLEPSRAGYGIDGETRPESHDKLPLPYARHAAEMQLRR